MSVRVRAIVFLGSGYLLLAYVVMQGLALWFFWIDCPEELVMLVKRDLGLGLAAGLAVFLVTHGHLARTNIRLYAFVGYVLSSISLTLFFLNHHIFQVASHLQVFHADISLPVYYRIVIQMVLDQIGNGITGECL